MFTIPKLFDINNKTKWKKYLDTYGYVVIKDILTQPQQLEFVHLFKEDFNTVTPTFSFDNPDSWNIHNMPLMYHKGMGIFNGFGQSNFMWYIRTNQNIVSIYKTIFDTNDICVSLDGFSMFATKDQKTKSWLHIDQNPQNPMYSIQGAYNLNKVGHKDAGFVVVSKTHKTYLPDISHKKDWIKCEDKELLNKARKLIIPENCFTLWNSKLIHCNTGMTHKSDFKSNNLIGINRITCYLTYLPKNCRSNEIYHKRIDAYKNGDTTSHWANKCEIKRYPWGFGPRYKSRGFNSIKPTLVKNKNSSEDFNTIPPERLELL